MANFGKKSDKYFALYAILGLVLLAAIAFGIVYFFGSSSQTRSSATRAAPAAPAAASLGSTAEGGVAYNRTFQERMLTTVNTAMEQMRNENKINMENFKREQAAKDEERDRRAQEEADAARETQQAAGEARMGAQVEPIKIHPGAGVNGKHSGLSDDGFFGSPSDVKDVGQEGAQPSPSPSRKDTMNLVVPPNGFIKGKTLNGVVAVVNAAAKPFLVKLQGQYRSANGYVMQLDSCIAYVEGRADLSAGRILGKPAKLTCNFTGRASKTWDVSGYIVDKDGIEGIVGVINDNGARKLAGAALGSGIAIAGARASAAQTQTYTGSGGVSSAVTGSIGADIAGGLAQGTGTELSRQVTEHYNQYQASVQVGGNREVTLVLLNELAVPDSGQEITPTHSASASKGN